MSLFKYVVNVLFLISFSADQNAMSDQRSIGAASASVRSDRIVTLSAHLYNKVSLTYLRTVKLSDRSVWTDLELYCPHEACGNCHRDGAVMVKLCYISFSFETLYFSRML